MAWEQLLSIAAEAAEYRRHDENEPPAACPHCGEPLREAERGGLYCPFAGDHEFHWP